MSTLDAISLIASLEEAAKILLSHPSRRGASAWLPGRGTLIATGDLHDNPYHLQRILDYADLARGEDRFVVLHELIHGERLVNGMDFSYRMLARVAELVRRFPGQVHPMLANHEIAQLTGRGVSKGAGNSVELFSDAVEYSFGDDAGEVTEAIHAFIRAMPLAVRSESGLLCAHSLPGSMAMRDFDPSVLDRPLVEGDFHPPRGAAYAMTWGRDFTHANVTALAQAWGVRLFCLGHRFVDAGIEVLFDNVIVLNSDHAQGRVLPIDLANLPAAAEAPLHVLPMA